MDKPTRTIGEQSKVSEEDLTFGYTKRTDSTVVCPVRTFGVGDQIDRYVLQRKLGDGGFGQVWLANDSRLDRDVAIKLPHRPLRSDSREAKRFCREAETAAKLAHPNLIPVLDAVLDAELAYIVSEYCPGPTLAQWNRERVDLPSPHIALLIVAQLADALRGAHQRGLIHRDIKPSNIILGDADTKNPVPRLTDFGLARAMSDESDTRMGTLIGSGPYMSPEQASGNTEDHGPHSDVHGLGLVLYELLTGLTPFASNNEVDTIQRVISQDPPSVRYLRPELSRDISAVCQRCLEKNPKRRYHDAGELYDDLQRILQGCPPLARPVGRLGRVQRWASRNKLVAGLTMFAAASLVLAIAGLAAFAIVSERHAQRSETQAAMLQDALIIAEQQRQLAEAQRTEALNQRNVAERTRRKWRGSSYTSDVSAAYLWFNGGHYGEARRLLDRQVPATGEEDLRDFEWWLLDAKLLDCYAYLGSHRDGADGCCFLDDEATLVTGGNDGNLVFWDVPSGKQKHQLTGLKDRLDVVAPSPSGNLFISSPEFLWFGRSVNEIDRETGRVIDVLHSHPTTIETVHTSRDGSVIASGSRYESIRCWLAKEKRSVTIQNRLRNECFALSQDGKRLATGMLGEPVLRVYDTHTGDVLDEKPLKSSVVKTCRSCENPWFGYTIRSVDGVGITRFDDMSESVWLPTQSYSGTLAFSADDRFLVVGSSRAGLDVFERVLDSTKLDQPMLPDYQPVASVAGIGGVVENLVVSRDGDIHTLTHSGSVERFSPLLNQSKAALVDTYPAHGYQRSLHPRADFLLTKRGYLEVALDSTANSNADAEVAEHLVDVAVPRAVDQSKQPTRLLAEFGILKSIAVSDDGLRLAAITRNKKCVVAALSMGSDGKVIATNQRVFNLPDVEPLERGLGLAVFSSSGRYLVCSLDRHKFYCFDLDRDQDKPLFSRNYENQQESLDISPDEQFWVCSGLTGLEVLEIETQKSLFLNPDLKSPQQVCFHPDGTKICVGMDDGTILVMDSRTGRHEFSLHGINSNGEHNGSVDRFEFYADNRMAVVCGTGEVQFWDWDQRLQLGGLEVLKPKRHISDWLDLCWDQERQEMILGYYDGRKVEVYRWGTRSSKPSTH
ncbi:Serine/threonine protein kinase [Neorhodopirellula lusitana]|uniref:Serine/threonine protein kinase n=1 Tax=Neorhodopirellula lusitana TaxID=445327 RepID=A0ABY1PNK6_9BACT|nr:WD40 repeat domain-containing serine/threonine protein kinase [Neorhodopirellula lusitana]SMP39519.1 Serine/threonine protein kinase [Neorhodopirellula lusitana]